MSRILRLGASGLASLAVFAQLFSCASPQGTNSGSAAGASPGPAVRAGSNTSPLEFEIEVQQSNTASRLQAVSAVDARIVWVSGLDGTIARTVDGGTTWHPRRGTGPTDTDTLQFRDIHAVDETTAFVLAAGEGELSRIYRTDDGGANWELQFLNADPEGFLDCFDFWTPDRGIAYGDSIDGELFVLTTRDGSSWAPVSPALLPAASEGEGGFAASGTCVETGPDGRAWIATGAGGSARVLATEDHGETWATAETPTVRGDSAGLMSVLFASHSLGVALGGDLEQPEEFTANVAITEDGGATWTPAGQLPFPGAAFGGAWRAGVLIANGPGGIAASTDSGRSWRLLSRADTWAVDFGDDDTFWAVGPEGRILRFQKR